MLSLWDTLLVMCYNLGRFRVWRQESVRISTDQMDGATTSVEQKS